jgi:hypothetical protein
MARISDGSPLGMERSHDGDNHVSKFRSGQRHRRPFAAPREQARISEDRRAAKITPPVGGEDTPAVVAEEHLCQGETPRAVMETRRYLPASSTPRGRLATGRGPDHWRGGDRSHADPHFSYPAYMLTRLTRPRP